MSQNTRGPCWPNLLTRMLLIMACSRAPWWPTWLQYQIALSYSKIWENGNSKNPRKLVFKTNFRVMRNAGQKYCRMHSAILSTFIKLAFVIKIFVLSNFWVTVLHRVCLVAPIMFQCNLTNILGWDIVWRIQDCHWGSHLGYQNLYDALMTPTDFWYNQYRFLGCCLKKMWR